MPNPFRELEDMILLELTPVTEKQRRLQIKESDLINEVIGEIFGVDNEDCNLHFSRCNKWRKKQYIIDVYGKDYFNNLSIRMKNAILNY